MSSIPRKRTKIRRFEAFLDFPQYMPDATNKAQLQYWYEQVKRTLKRINDDLSIPLDDLQTSVEELQTALDALQKTVDAIQSAPPTPAGEQCCDELRALIAALTIRVTNLENATPGISGIEGQDEGSILGQFTKINFVGSGVVATLVGGVLTVTISAGSSTCPCYPPFTITIDGGDAAYARYNGDSLDGGDAGLTPTLGDVVDGGNAGSP